MSAARPWQIVPTTRFAFTEARLPPIGLAKRKKADGESLSGYFRKLFESNLDWLSSSSNDVVKEKYKADKGKSDKKSSGGRLNPIKLRQMKQRRQAIEDEVTRLEVEIADYEAALANFKSAEETIRLSEVLAARRNDLTALMSEWEQVAELIEASR